MDKSNQAILKTLVYADIFDYPLTAKEIQKWLISSTKIKLSPKSFKNISKTKSFYHLKSRQSIVNLRHGRAHQTSKKLKIAKRTAKYLSLIPTIKLVAITGALSMSNSSKNDDIDLMIVTKNNYLWTTRLLSVLLLELTGQRRRPLSTNSNLENNNKICLNLFLDESSLALSKSQQNLYTAHEVAQVKPIFNKDNTYQDFLNANSWASRFLPHALKTTQVKSASFKTTTTKLETLAYKLQLKIMNKKRTREKISPHLAFFHPRPTGEIILKKYNQKLKKL